PRHGVKREAGIGENQRRFASFHRHTPQPSREARVIEDSAIGRFKRLVAVIAGHLLRGTAAGRDLPDFVTAGAVRTEVDALAIAGKAGTNVAGWAIRQTTWLTAFGSDGEDHAVAVFVAVEDYDLPVGRPARAAHRSGPHVGEGHRVRAAET